jgi:hypothetical protein
MRTYDENLPPNDGICIQCKKDWDEHSRWSCNPAAGAYTMRINVPSRHAYFSQRMLDEWNELHGVKPIRDSGLPAIAAMQASTPDLSDWKLWRDVNRKPDECPCGIRRSACRYH